MKLLFRLEGRREWYYSLGGHRVMIKLDKYDSGTRTDITVEVLRTWWVRLLHNSEDEPAGVTGREEVDAYMVDRGLFYATALIDG